MDEDVFPFQNPELQDISYNTPNQQLNIENITTEELNLQPYFTGTSTINPTYLNLALQPKFASYCKTLNWNVQVPIIIVQNQLS